MMPSQKSATPTPLPASQEVDWEDLRYFRAIAETLNLTRAADRLRTTQSTVSKYLDRLELRLGAALATRSQAGVVLTDAGRILADHVATMDRTAAAATKAVSQRDRAAAGKVSIVCPDAMAVYILAPALAGFQRAFPSIRIEVRTKSDPNVAPDLSIQFRETKRMEDVAIPLGWLHYVAFASRGYLDLFNEPTALTDAFQHKIVVHLDHLEQMERWKEKVRPLQEMLDPALTTDSGMFYARAVLNGAGVAAMPTYFARYEPDLVMVNTGEYACLRFWLVFDRENGERARVREVIELIKGLFELRRNPWFREELIAPSEFDAMLAR